MLSDLTRGSSADPRNRECGDGKPACTLPPAHDADNPLGLCEDHLLAYRRRMGRPDPVTCPACAPIAVFANGAWIVPAGVMCFACGKANGGTMASETHRAAARGKMRARLIDLYDAGERGPEWTALLARCPAEMREAFERRLAGVTPAPGGVVESVK